MLVVTTNQNDFETDIHSLVKAFYPAEEVKIYLGDEAGLEVVSSDPGLPDININFIDNRILMMLFLNDQEDNGISEEDLSDEEKIRRAIGESNKASSNIQVIGVDINETMSRLEVKNALKQLLYYCLSNHTETVLPWGALTGIRPAKIPMNLLADGYNEDEIITHMQEVYFCSKEKALLALDIAKREREILQGLDLHESYSLYIAIPFCPTTCLYCSFTSYPITRFRDVVLDYLTALFKEIDFIADLYKEKRLTTIYIGGGTPTTLTPKQLEQLLGKIKTSFDFTYLVEFTVEAGRPDSITREKLAVLKTYGADRISINPQSMNDKTLELIGRKHTVLDVSEAFKLAREMCFTNINMDLILGLPEEELADVSETMRAVSELKPDSITIHSLAIKRAAKLTEWVNENGLDSLLLTEEEMQIAADGVVKLGMHPYYLYRQKNMAGNFENVGYATPGKYGLYNILMMEEVQTIVALGAGSVSKRLYADGNVRRCDNVKEVDQYIDRISEMIERKRELFT